MLTEPTTKPALPVVTVNAPGAFVSVDPVEILIGPDADIGPLLPVFNVNEPPVVLPEL